MTKVTDQDVPADKQAAFFRLWSPATAAAPPTGTGRTRRAARQRPTRKKKHKLNRWLRPICEQIARAYANTQGIDYSESLTTRIYQLALAGQYPEDYWTRLTPSATDHYRTTATSIPDPAPPAYAYRMPTNLPTLPTYADGTPAAGPPAYQGETVGGYFADLAYTWARYTYTLKTPLVPGRSARMIVTYAASLSINADIRPSRPMFSHIARIRLFNVGDPWETDTTPPHLAASVIYSRFKPPKGRPPFFNYIQPINVTAPLQTRTPTPMAATYTRLALDLAPLPMNGRRFNNNTTVDTELTLDAAPIIYAPKIATWPAPQPIRTFPALGYSDMGSDAVTPWPTTPPQAALRTNGTSFVYHAGTYPIGIYDADLSHINDLAEYDADGYRLVAVRSYALGFIGERERQNPSNPSEWWRRTCTYDTAGNLTGQTSKTWFAGLDQLSDYIRRAIPDSCMFKPSVPPYPFYTDESNDPAGYLPAITDTAGIACSGDGIYLVTNGGDLYRAPYPTRAQLNTAAPPTFAWTLVKSLSLPARVLLPAASGAFIWELATRWHQYTPSGKVRSFANSDNTNYLSHIWRLSAAMPPP